MRTIYKYTLQHIPNERQTKKLPKDTKIVHCAMQHGVPTLWAEVDEENAALMPEQRHFEIYGTGYSIMADRSRHVGTIFDGPYVWHIYEVTGDGPTRKD